MSPMCAINAVPLLTTMAVKVAPIPFNSAFASAFAKYGLVRENYCIVKSGRIDPVKSLQVVIKQVDGHIAGVPAAIFTAHAVRDREQQSVFSYLRPVPSKIITDRRRPA